MLLALERFAERWDHKYPHISRTWRQHWQNLSTLFRYPDVSNFKKYLSTRKMLS